MNKLYSILLVSISLFAGTATAAEEWELRKDEDGIQVYTRSVDGSPYKAVKATTVLGSVTLASLVALIEDAEACPNWADKCAESFVHERVSDTEAYVYTHNSMPFPVKDRDVLAHVNWAQDPGTLQVVMTSIATVGIMEEKRGRLRLERANAKWTFTPAGSGAIEVSNEAHIDPGSNIPGWLTNMLLVDTPFQTMLAFTEEVVKPKYQNSEVGFIQEPTSK